MLGYARPSIAQIVPPVSVVSPHQMSASTVRCRCGHRLGHVGCRCERHRCARFVAQGLRKKSSVRIR